MNDYSQQWFELFLETQRFTGQEVAFLKRQLPLPAHRRVLDVACGRGRHACLLAQAGYRVVGVDLDAAALAIARSRCRAGAEFLRADMRELGALRSATFDAAVCLWQSFGYFDPETNRDVLRQVASRLRSGGRFILDIYRRDYFQRNQGRRVVERNGAPITIDERVRQGRLTACLNYGHDGRRECFDWQLYQPEEIIAEAAACGLSPLLLCTEASEKRPAAADKPRMIIVFERTGGEL